MSDDSGRRWDRAQNRGRSGGGAMSEEERRERLRLLRERVPTAEDANREAERIERVRRLREKQRRG